jgi:hypothetical protein
MCVINFNSEKDMEDFFFRYSGHYAGWFDLEPNDIEWKKQRQVNFGSYGICDILFMAASSASGQPTLKVRLVELKNTPLNANHIAQVARYKQFFGEIEEYANYLVDFRAYLVGLPTPISDFVYLAQNIEWLDVFEVSIAPSGVRLCILSDWKPNAFAEIELTAFLGINADHLFDDTEVGQNG